MLNKNIYKKIIIATLTIAFVVSNVFVIVSKANAAFNRQINYQGKLTNTSNVAVADGLYTVQFSLYTVPTGGTAIWTENDTGANKIQVTNGLFSVMMGSTTPFTGVDFGQTLYLGVKIESDSEMTPRKVIGAVPAAFVADTLNGISSNQFIRNDIQNATSSTGTFLNISQTGTGKIAEFFGTSSNSVLSILSGGNVGIGTTTPFAQLSVKGANGAPTSNLPGAIGMAVYGGNGSRSGAGGGLILNAGNGGDAFGFGSAGLGGNINFSAGNGGSGSLNGTAAAGGNITINPGLGGDGIAANGNVLLATLGGNIGIGTTSPSNKLEVAGNGFFAGNLTATGTVSASNLFLNSGGTITVNDPAWQIKLRSTAATTLLGSNWKNTFSNGNQPYEGFAIMGNAGSVFEVANNGIGYFKGLLGFGTTTPDAKISIIGSSTDSTYALSIKNSALASLFNVENNGNVGIGTTSPSNRLEVSGNTFLGGNLTAAGTLSVGTLSGILFGTNGVVSSIATSSLGLQPALTGGVLNSLTYWTGAGTLAATSSPVVGYITSTSNTSTSTFPIASTSNLTISSALNFAPVVIYKPNGTQIAYGQGATTDNARGDAVLAAKSDAQSGDLIAVYSDATTVNDSVGKTGVRWYFAPGVTLNNFGISGASDMQGYGTFVLNDQGIEMYSARKIDVKDITVNGSGSTVVYAGGTGYSSTVKANKLVSTNYDVIGSDADDDTTYLTVTADELIAGDQIIEKGTGNVTVYARTAKTTGAYAAIKGYTLATGRLDAYFAQKLDASSSGLAIETQPTGVISSPIIYGGIENAGQFASTTIITNLIDTTSTSSSSIFVTGNNLTLVGDIQIITSPTATYSISAVSGPKTIVLNGSLRVNKPIDPNITILGGRVIVDSTNDNYFQSGNFGIGTTTPSSRLTVSGSSFLGGNVTATGTLSVTSTTTTGGLSVGSLSGLLFGTNGSVSAIATSSLGFGSSFFQQNGNSFGADAVLGTNDNQALNFETNNATKMTILANGNVGIGTTTPTAKLEVTGGIAQLRTSDGFGNYWSIGRDNASTGDLQFNTSAGTKMSVSSAAPNNSFRLNNIGNVGIGTSTPSNRLEVSGNSYLGGNVTAAGTLRVTSTSTLSSGLYVEGNTLLGTTTATALAPLQIGGLANANAAVNYNSATRVRIVSATAQSSTSPESMLRLVRPENNANYYPASVDFNVDAYQGGGSGTNYNPATRLTFSLKNSSNWNDSADTNIMSLLANGNVGIGTTTPSSKLSVIGNGYFAGNLTAANINATGTLSVTSTTTTGTLSVGTLSGLLFGTNGVVSSIATSSLGLGASFFQQNGNSFGATAVLGTNDNQALSFETNNSRKMTILANGNVGIGTTSPASTLTVQGNAAIGNASNGYVTSDGTGSFAGGSSIALGEIRSSGTGSFAFGNTMSLGKIISTGSGSFAGGEGAGSGYSILSSGTASFAFGKGVSATATLATAFGTGFTNSTINSFMIGYSSIPVFTASDSGIILGTTTKAQLVANAKGVVVGNPGTFSNIQTAPFEVLTDETWSNEWTTANKFFGDGVFGELRTGFNIGTAVAEIQGYNSGTPNSGTYGPLVLNGYGGNVGIGTLTPSATLTVAGDTFVGGNITATGTLNISSTANIGSSLTADYIIATSTSKVSTFAYGTVAGQQSILNPCAQCFSTTTTIINFKSNGAVEYYNPSSNTDIDRGTLLVSVVGSAGAGDKIWLNTGRYDIQDSRIDLSLGGSLTDSISLYGNGKYNTLIERSISGTSINIIMMGAYTTIQDLGISTIETSNYAAAISDYYMYGSPVPIKSGLIKNVYASSTSDILMFSNDSAGANVNLTVDNLTTISQYDSLAFFVPGTINIYNSTLYQKAAGAFLGQARGMNVYNGTVNIYNTDITSINVDGSGNARGVETGGTLNYYSGSISTTGTDAKDFVITGKAFIGSRVKYNHLNSIGAIYPLNNDIALTTQGKIISEGGIDVVSQASSTLPNLETTNFFTEKFMSTGDTFLGINSGNIGIGTTTPTSKLTVSGDSFFGGNITATGTLTVTSTTTIGGRLGVGTTNPLSKLSVSTNAETGDGIFLTTGGGWSPGDNVGLYFGDTSGNSSLIVPYSSSAIWKTYYGLALNRGQSGSNVLVAGTNGADDVGIGGAINSGNLSGSTMVVKGTGNVGIGNTTPSARLEIDQLSTDTTTPFLRVKRTNDAGTPQSTNAFEYVNNGNAMQYKIDSYGRPWAPIGYFGSFTASDYNNATNPLNVVSQTGDTVAEFDSKAAIGRSMIRFSNASSTGAYMYMGTYSNPLVGINNGANQQYAFYGSNVTPALVINNPDAGGNGNVGIGTTTPSQRLTVTNGNIASTQTIGFLASSTKQNIAGIHAVDLTNGHGLAPELTYTYDGVGYRLLTGNYSGIGILMDANPAYGALAVNGQISIVSSSTPNLYMTNSAQTSSATFGPVQTAGGLLPDSQFGDFGIVGTNDIVFGTYSNGRLMTLKKTTGNLGLGTSTPSSKLTVVGTTYLNGNATTTGSLFLTGLPLSTTGNYLCIDTTTKQITSGTTCTLSSSRFKDNIAPIDMGLNTVLALNPVTFKFKDGYGDNGNTTQMGFVAEQANAIDPRLVPHDEDGLPSGFNYANFTAVLTKAIQEQQVQINALKNATTTTTVVTQDSYTVSTSTVESVATTVLTQSTSFIATIANAVKDLISSAGDWAVAKLSATYVYSKKVEAETVAVSQGLEMKDQATGQTYCVVIKNGDWDKRVGTCAEIAQATTTPVVTPVIINTYIPSVQNSTTTENEIATTTASTTITTVTTSTVISTSTQTSNPVDSNIVSSSSTPLTSTTTTITTTNTDEAITTTNPEASTETTTTTNSANTETPTETTPTIETTPVTAPVTATESAPANPVSEPSPAPIDSTP